MNKKETFVKILDQKLEKYPEILREQMREEMIRDFDKISHLI
jgi:hypothetical protein